MPLKQPSLRFEHKEIAVIFSLFVFVALLMFTVGILVGKGLTMAKYEGQLTAGTSLASEESEIRLPPGREIARALPPTVEDTLTPPKKNEPAESEYVPKNQPLDLVPKKNTKTASALGNSLLEVKGRKSEAILKNPRVKALLESTPSRGLASTGKGEAGGQPISFAKGKFTVQVGSFPDKKEADARIEKLKQWGFAHAYVTSTQLGDKKQTWFRVWLGYYPDFNSAKENAEILQKKGEVKNYLVRKADQAEG